MKKQRWSGLAQRWRQVVMVILLVTLVFDQLPNRGLASALDPEQEKKDTVANQLGLDPSQVQIISSDDEPEVTPGSEDESGGTPAGEGQEQQSGPSSDKQPAEDTQGESNNNQGDGQGDEEKPTPKPEPERVMIHFDANGGSGSMSDMVTLIDGQPFKLANNAFTRDDFVFVGWSTTADGKDVKDNPDTEDKDETMPAIEVNDAQEMTNLGYTLEQEDKESIQCDLNRAVRDHKLTLYAQWRAEETPAESEDGEPKEDEPGDDKAKDDKAKGGDEKGSGTNGPTSTDEIEDPNKTQPEGDPTDDDVLAKGGTKKGGASTTSGDTTTSGDEVLDGQEKPDQDDPEAPQNGTNIQSALPDPLAEPTQGPSVWGWGSSYVSYP